MNAANMVTAPPSLLRNRRFLIALPAVLLFVAVMGFNLWRAYGPALFPTTGNSLPINAEMEDKFGVRFTALHVIAKGGLIDLRYRVIDAAKAKSFGHYTETSPILIAADGRLVEVTIMGLHNHRVETGRIYYILYRNTSNIIKPGDKVTIGVGEVLFPDFIAQ